VLIMIGKRIRSLSQIFILSHLSLAPIVKLVPHRCEPFSTYPRTYDLLHADHLFTHYKIYGEGCLLEDIMLEMDRIIRPQVFYKALTLSVSLPFSHNPSHLVMSVTGNNG